MTKFDLSNYPKNDNCHFIMHCKTKKEAEMFCEYLDSRGRTWCTGESYLSRNNYTVYKEGTCYWFNNGTFGSLETAMGEEAREILCASEFIFDSSEDDVDEYIYSGELDEFLESFTLL